MVRTRLLLILSGILSASWFYAGINLADKSDNFSFFDVVFGFGMIFGPILFLATIFMLVFSFFRVSETSDGKLEYDPANLHWRLLKRFFEIKGNISLCSAFWLTSLMTFIAVFLTGAAILFSWIFYKEGFGPFLLTFSKMLPILAVLGSIFGIFIPLKFWPENNLVRKISVSWLFMALFGWLVIAPFYVMFFRQGLPMSSAIWKYLGGIGEMVSVVIPIWVAFGLVLLLAKYFSSISGDSLLKRIFTALKNNMCPILFERSAAGK